MYGHGHQPLLASSGASTPRGVPRLPKLVLIAASFFVVINISGFQTSRLLHNFRVLCSTHFPHGHWPSRSEIYWEELFGAVTDYSSPETEDEYFFDESNIAYIVTLTSCPEDAAAPDSCLPTRSLYDSGAILKYGFCEKHLPHEPSKYTSSMSVLVHPDAVRCVGPNGEEYDRVAVLREMGYSAHIHGNPVGGGEVGGQAMYDAIEADVGLADLVKIAGMKFDGSPVVVLVDFATMAMGPMDAAVDSFLAGDEHVLITEAYTMLKPDRTVYDAMVQHYKDNVASFPTGFKGQYGTRGLLQHFYGEGGPNPGYIKTGSDPNVINLCENGCGLPWECPNIDAMVDPALTTCKNQIGYWYEQRTIFEEQYWVEGVYSHLNGQYHPDVYKGFCFSSGPEGYDMMIDDKDPAINCDANTITSEDAQSMDIGLGRTQTQVLALTTGATTASNTACISGTISKENAVPVYNIAIVMDISKSTKSNFGGSYVGDMNGDGNENKIIDAEIAAVIALLENIVADPTMTNENVLIGLVYFYEFAEYKGAFPPADPNDPTKVNPALINLLTSIEILWGTNFDDGLDKAIDFFNEAPSGRTNIMYFLSDGKPYNRGDGDNEPEIIVDGVVKRGYKNHPANLMYDSELAALDAMNVERFAIGMGDGSEVSIGSGLDMIDNTPDLESGLNAIKVTTTEALTEALQASPIPATVSEFILTVNGVTQPITAANVTSGPTGFTFGEVLGYGFNSAPGYENIVTAEMTMLLNDVSTVFTTSNTVTGAGIGN